MFRRKPILQPGLIESADDSAALAPERCLNCGATVASKFCAECGQEHSHKVVSIWRLANDFLGEVFSWDSKLIHTTKYLLFAPGLLTVEYVSGRRARYLSPFRLYLYASAAMFYLLTVQVAHFPPTGRTGPIQITVGSGQDVHSAEEYLAEQARVPAGKREPALVRLIVTKALKLSKSSNGDIGARLVGGAVEAAPKCLFVLLPVFAALLKLIYLRRGRLYIEHLVFALHCHAFVFTLTSVEMAWRLYGQAASASHAPHRIGPAWFGLLFALTVVYLVLAMKRVYRQGWMKTVVKFGILTLAYGVLFWLAVAGAIVIALIAS